VPPRCRAISMHKPIVSFSDAISQASMVDGGVLEFVSCVLGFSLPIEICSDWGSILCSSFPLKPAAWSRALE
jgi:hypothetical protein